VAIKQFGPGARRAALMRAFLAMVGLVAGAVAWFQGSGVGWLAGGLLSRWGRLHAVLLSAGR